MNPDRDHKLVQHNRQSVISLALVRYNFSTPEIRVLMRHVLGHAVSGRTIKRLARSAGQRLKRGRPATTARVHKSDAGDLIEATGNGLDLFSGNTLQFFHTFRFNSVSHPVSISYGRQSLFAAESI